MGSNQIDLSGDRTVAIPALERMGLLHPGETLRIEPLAGGVSSNIFEVQTNRKHFCLKQALATLKVAKEWKAPIDRVYAEIDWLNIANELEPGFAPRILGVDRDTASFAMEFLPPEDFPNWKTHLLAGMVDQDVAGRLGARLVSFHSKTANRKEKLANIFATDSNFASLRLDPYLGETARAHPDLATRLNEILEQTRTTKLALVHGDVSPKNILLGRNGPVLLDAECAWWGDPAFDLAFCLNHLLLKTIKLPDLTKSLVESIGLMAETYLAGVDWEQQHHLEVRACHLVAGLLLARIDGKSPVEYLDDMQRQTVRSAARSLLRKTPEQLDDLANTFTRITVQ